MSLRNCSSTQVTQILLQPDSHLKGTYTASGVKFVVNSTEYSVNARKEVILSAGTIQTPQLLELSGKLAMYRYNGNKLIALRGHTRHRKSYFTDVVERNNSDRSSWRRRESPSRL